MIEEIAECRRHGANMLLNVGPMPNGLLRPIDACYLEILGKWMDFYGEAVSRPRPCNIPVKSGSNNFLLKDGNNYYLFVLGLITWVSPNVTAEVHASLKNEFVLPEKVVSATWIDCGKAIEFTQDDDGKVTLTAEHFKYGSNYVVRVAKITCEE